MKRDGYYRVFLIYAGRIIGTVAYMLWMDDLWIGRLEDVKLEKSCNEEGTLEFQQSDDNILKLLLSNIGRYIGGFCGAS